MIVVKNLLTGIFVGNFIRMAADSSSECSEKGGKSKLSKKVLDINLFQIRIEIRQTNEIISIAVTIY